MILIIAYGNSLRRDDGAGLVLAERLEQVWLAGRIEVERLVVQQLTPELALDIAREEVTAVLFTDTRAVIPEEVEPGLQMWAIRPNPDSPSLGHHLDPAAVLAYAHLLYGKQLPAWIVTAPGVDFEHGEGLSQMAEQALNTIPELATKLLEVLCVYKRF